MYGPHREAYVKNHKIKQRLIETSQCYVYRGPRKEASGNKGHSTYTFYMYGPHKEAYV